MLLSCAGTGKTSSLGIPRYAFVYLLIGLKALAVLVAGCAKASPAQECHCSKSWHILQSEKQMCSSNPTSQLGQKCKIPQVG